MASHALGTDAELGHSISIEHACSWHCSILPTSTACALCCSGAHGCVVHLFWHDFPPMTLQGEELKVSSSAVGCYILGAYIEREEVQHGAVILVSSAKEKPVLWRPVV